MAGQGCYSCRSRTEANGVRLVREASARVVSVLAGGLEGEPRTRGVPPWTRSAGRHEAPVERHALCSALVGGFLFTSCSHEGRSAGIPALCTPKLLAEDLAFGLPDLLQSSCVASFYGLECTEPDGADGSDAVSLIG